MSASARARASKKYKSRLSLERGGYGPRIGTPMSGAERARRFRERLKADAARNFSSAANLASTSATGIPVLMEVTNEQTIDISIGSPTELRNLNISRSEAMQNHWRSADKRFKTVFEANPFGLSCSVCDRLWFERDLKKVKHRNISFLQIKFPNENVTEFRLCSTCSKSIDANKIPTLSRSNGFRYPPKSSGLPLLDPISIRLISPRLPFMQIRRLRYEGNYGIVGQVINVPVDVNNMVQQLPRRIDDDFAFNVNIKKKLIHKSNYLSGFVRKSVIKAWLRYLVNQPLYKHYDIKIDWSVFDKDMDDYIGLEFQIESVDPDFAPESEILLARQHTLLWNEEQCLDIAPGQNSSPINIIYDVHGEELSFPQIYYGVPRQFDLNVRVTPYMMATSEIRRTDRRGATPDHVLYMAMKMLRIRVVEGVYNMFRCVKQTESITRKMLEDRNFMDECIDKNFVFLKSIPNSIQYWMTRKKDLFAMLRQLGKPTLFLTISANEIKWPKLLKILYGLSNSSKDIHIEDPLVNLNQSQRSHLVNEDPVTCCVYFNKLVDTIMAMLQAKMTYNPFGPYRVLDYFLRIEFQHRGSPHAHVLLWLENDPHEKISENMSKTIQLLIDLCSVSRNDLPGELYANQVHKHTFTCTKRGETSCRFGIPYWPMTETRVLLPLPKDDGRKNGLQTRATKLRKLLEEKNYETLGEFLVDNNLTMAHYLDTIRATLRRPTVVFKRDLSEIYTNTFNPWIARTVCANSDLQFILEEYSCAAYVVEYVNKSNRGISNLHQELIKIQEQNPEKEYVEIMKQLGVKFLNTVEMSSQEAAWYLLRQPMSRSSREVSYIPTVWPQERHKLRKRKAVMEEENLDENSTDIWTKSMIQRYEERPSELEDKCLADFVAWYTPVTKKKGQPLGTGVNDDASGDDEPALDNVPYESTSTIGSAYRKRSAPRVIRYRGYELNDVVNYKREMVTLYLPFKNEAVEILDRNGFLRMYDEREAEIMAKRKEFESNIDIAKILDELKKICEDFDNVDPLDTSNSRDDFVRNVLGPDGTENNDDFENAVNTIGISAVRKRSNVMSKQEYCHMMRSTNNGQRELILETIHRLHLSDLIPIQIFFTGPAGSGKTYVLKLLMETYNRYTQQHNLLRNAFVACASTGKAAVNLGGVTVHSAFKITHSRRIGTMAREVLQNYRSTFIGVKCIIIDEVSMIGCDVLHKINLRLQEITGIHDQPFGNLNIIFCGDLHQLPPVNASPVYKGPRNSICGPVLWQSLDYYPLEQVMRQSDSTFSEILTKIGNGERLGTEQIALIESRFRSRAWCKVNVPASVRLFHRNHDVDAYNNNAFIPEFENIADDKMIGYNTLTEVATARRNLHKMSVVESGGLPYSLKLAVGYPYMITMNLDVEDGLVNGAIGTLKYIEYLTEDEQVTIYGTTEVDVEPQPSTSTRIWKRVRLWLEFSNPSMGQLCRVKAKPHVMCKRDVLDLKWTPIVTRAANIPLGGNIKCRRNQFPVVSASAITIHKSQGGTFDEVVFNYDKSQQTQLVYIALSRVTSIDGLYLTNDKDDLKFYHGRGSTAPTVKDIRDEYDRMANHRLTTLSMQARAFCKRDVLAERNEDQGGYLHRRRQLILIVSAFNAQSLVAHAGDIESDNILMNSDYMVISETWMNCENTVMVNGFELRASNNTALEHRTHCPSTSSELPVRVSAAGGSAIYRNLQSSTYCSEIIVNANKSCGNSVLRKHNVGDICLVDVKVEDRTLFILGAVYIHPKASAEAVKLCLYQSLLPYSAKLTKLIPNSQPDLETPIVLCGDFNSDPQQNSYLVEFMRNEFGLNYIQTSPTTLGNTTIDCTFTRNINVDIMPCSDGFKLASSGSGSPAPPPVQWRVRRKPGIFHPVRKFDGFHTSLQLRSIEEPPGGAGGMPAPTCYDAECVRTEAWLDENQEFVHDYFLRKATRQVVDAWLVSHATPPSAELASPSRAGSGSGATTPVRKISAHEFERGGLLKPLVTTVDGTPTFLGDQPHATPSRPQRRSRHELRQLDEKELIFELVKDICNELEVRVLCHKILQNVSILLDADRGSLFLVQGERASSPQPQNGRCLVSKLFDVCSKSTPEQMEQLEEIRIPWGSGIVGYVAESGEPVNIPDAYKDKRFNHDIDQQTGYKTRSLLCMPIKDISGEVIGVAQVINKQNDGPFTSYDEKVFSSYLQFCGIGLRNAQLYERSQLEVKRNQVLLDLARMVFEEQSTIEHMMLRILTHTQSLIRCQRVQVLLVHEASKGSFSRVFDLEAGDDAEPGTPRTSPYESRFPINIGITGYVATTGETVNIGDAYMDPRFDPSVDEGAGFKHNTILCMAIKNSEGRIIGVIQLVNKFDDLLFTKNDENFVEAFAIFCGMGIHNTHMYEKAITAMAKQSVTLDVLSYHASASLDDAQRLRSLRIPSSIHFNLHHLAFDDIDLTDDDTLRACLRMFLDLDFVERFHIDYSVLCRWLLSVKKNYRNVTYHNWRHAFNVAQMMFAILTETQWWKIFGELECLALIIGCLCHDLDHRGTNNSFQIKASSPLAQLYSTSTMEHHHFDQCLMILNSPGNQVLANLSSEDYEKVVKVLEDAILSTDLAVYFSKRGSFLELVASSGGVVAWGECGRRRALLRAMSMTACDLAAITKPWPVERRVAALVAGEFFRQGDLERQNLNLTPIDIMNRDKEDQLPAMQVKFIDSICLPIYEAFAVLSPALQPMLDRVKSNRAHWIELSETDEKFDYSLDPGHIDKNDKSSISSHVDDTDTYEGDSSGAVSLSSETNSKYETLENPVVGLVCNNTLTLSRDPKICQIND